MSASSQSMSTSPANSQAMVDPLDSLLDFSEYDNVSYQSPSLSPAASNKIPFARPVPAAAQSTQNSSLLSTSQGLSGPSHQYDLYKQQTGIVPGALASTLAVNQNNSQVSGYSNFNIESYMGVSSDEMFDFNTSPNEGTMDLEFDSPNSDPNFFFPEPTINPNAMGGQESPNLPSPPVLATQTSNVGRLWPGMHQQAALAKAQAQQRQQQQIIQQQQANRQSQQVKPPPQRQSKSAQPSDPIVEQKITQLLNSMRAKTADPNDDGSQTPNLNITRPKKEEDDMDEDERLLASEEGKKLSSKERRQLRNKVSARAFRSRRKEYITQLEAEIANKVTENGDLRAQNRALIDENRRLSDLTRMLLSSAPFSEFLDRLSSNPSSVPQVPQPEQRPSQEQPQQRQVPKDVNPYGAAQQSMQQRIGMAAIPEQGTDFNMLNMEGPADGFGYQPQVFAVLDTTPESPIDIGTLSGKVSNFVGEQFDVEDNEKVEIPTIDRAPVDESKLTAPETPVEVPDLDEAFENNPAFALYHTAPAPTCEQADKPVELDTDGFSHVDLFGGIETEKALARFELLDASKEEASAAFAMAKVQRISARLEDCMRSLESLTVDL